VDNPVAKSSNPWPVIVLVLGAAIILWFGYQKLRTPSRCKDIQFQATANDLGPDNHAPVKPSDARWYNEHCWEGRPR
jgi:hypothetical protein